jgi:hypothetical protein
MDLPAAEKYILEKLESELSPNLTYHCKGHVLDVLNAAMMYAELEQITVYEKLLLKTAVLFHDSGFIVQAKEHEAIGCEIARKSLPGFGYTEEEIARICGMIMATRIPQTAHNKLEEIICDSDLDYLGRDDFWHIGPTLFTELKTFGVIENEEAWNRMQLKFLNTHRYLTEHAIRLRKAKKQEHIRQIQAIVDGYS